MTFNLERCLALKIAIEQSLQSGKPCLCPPSSHKHRPPRSEGPKMSKDSLLLMSLKASPAFNPLRYRKTITVNPLKHVSPCSKISILSFNMLNQSYMWPQVYNEYVAPEHQSWNYRFPLLKATISNDEIRSDIMCFQEMESRSFEMEWAPLMRSRGYNGEFIKKSKPVYWEKQHTNSPDLDLIDGVSVFYDNNKFEQLECYKFKITDYFEKHFKNSYGLGLNMETIEDIFKKRNQVGLIMVLRHKGSNETIIVANTHLYWKYDDIKLLQIMMLLEALADVQSRHVNAKIFLSGDFNSNPNSSLYKFLRNNELSTSEQDLAKYISPQNQKRRIKNPIHTSANILDTLIDQDPEVGQKKYGQLFTCYTHSLFGVFDYIWFNDRDFELLNLLSGVDPSYLSNIKGLPNADFPSDHIPIRAEFEIKR